MIEFRDFTQPRFHPDRLLCNTGIEALAIAGAVASVGSIGMTIMGASQQADAQRMAGDAAYQNALARKAQLDNEAAQREALAKAEQAAAQRRSIEENRKGRIVAGRAQAVMAASGAGVDNRIIAGILGEGDYAGDVALYEGEDRAQKQNYQATVNRFEGDQGVARGRYTRDVMRSRADTTMAMGIGKSLFQGLSLAAKYGGDFGGSRYDLSRDPLRTANDADLGGYGGLA